ncbi:hypothetical protein WJX72_008767 [[Myrmecia] bisecta]|uniref:beta-aspartyl-peptidase n=1 Tax=[Myrmecia] bisecta TaxID=41462 RepID=A0AAW1QFT4_9CHLO
MVVNTWAFTKATARAWDVLSSSKSAVDAVEQGCSLCEEQQCDFTVGFGGSPGEDSETTLDALIMEGTNMDAGAVSDLRHVKHAIGTARLVMEHTNHTMLAGLQATAFAVEMGMKLANLSTPASSDMYYRWQNNNCQPNFRRRVSPDPRKHCGPYKKVDTNEQSELAGRQLLDASGMQLPGHSSLWVGPENHDTISMVAIDKDGNVAAGSSSNGANHKVPGRVGDASVPGGGAYADSEVGGCGSTGDGDLHMRFLPCYQVVESMRQGMHPTEAAEDAVRRIVKRFPGYVGALFGVDKEGRHGGAAHGWTFTYAVRDASMSDVELHQIESM